MGKSFEASHMIEEYFTSLKLWLYGKTIQDFTKIDSTFYLNVFNQNKDDILVNKDTGVSIIYRKVNPNLMLLRGKSSVGTLTSFNFYDPANKQIWDAMVLSTETAKMHGLPVLIEKI
jgi:hypothetical protein